MTSHLDIESAAKEFKKRGIKVCPKTIWRWCRRGKLKHFKAGRVIAISREQISSFIERQTR